MEGKKILKIITSVILIIYFIFVLLLSIFILMENEYGISGTKNKSFIIINEINKNNNYNSGDLVIVKNKTFDEVVVGEEVFIYKSDSKNIIYVEPSIITSKNEDNKYITIENDNGVWDEKLIIGTKKNVISKLGKIISFLKKDIQTIITTTDINDISLKLCCKSWKEAL